MCTYKSIIINTAIFHKNVFALVGSSSSLGFRTEHVLSALKLSCGFWIKPPTCWSRYSRFLWSCTSKMSSWCVSNPAAAAAYSTQKHQMERWRPRHRRGHTHADHAIANHNTVWGITLTLIRTDKYMPSITSYCTYKWSVTWSHDLLILNWQGCNWLAPC